MLCESCTGGEEPPHEQQQSFPSSKGWSEMDPALTVGAMLCKPPELKKVPQKIKVETFTTSHSTFLENSNRLEPEAKRL